MCHALLFKRSLTFYDVGLFSFQYEKKTDIIGIDDEYCFTLKGKTRSDAPERN